jgi:hypothetical protein
LRAHLAELGIVAAQGREGLKQLLAIIADEKDARLPIDARASLIVLAAQLQALHTMIGSLERRLILTVIRRRKRAPSTTSQADLSRCSNIRCRKPTYSITTSARPSSSGGTVIPSFWAVT